MRTKIGFYTLNTGAAAVLLAIPVAMIFDSVNIFAGGIIGGVLVTIIGSIIVND